MNNTSYTTTFLPPPKNLYTGISPNLGLKARVEGVAAASDPALLGLGETGVTSYHKALPRHTSSAYKDRVKPDPAALKSRLKMDKGHAGYVTSYSVWGNQEAALPISAKADAIKGPEQTIVGAIGYGLDGETMYHSTYKVPQGEQGYQSAKIVTKDDVEGVPEAKVVPYGALCKSLVHESFQAPPAEAYQRPRTSMKPTRPAADLGNLGLGDNKATQYSLAYQMHRPEDYLNARPVTGKKVVASNIKIGGGQLMNNTSYTTTFLPPPKNLYTGISPNLGLKARVEGVAAASDPALLGLGETGVTSYHKALPRHTSSAYKDRVKPDPAALKSRLKMDKGHAGYVTSYSVWGNQEAALPISAKADAIKGPEQTIVGAIGYGLDGETMYHSTYKVPQGEQGYQSAKIVTKDDVEGVPEAKVVPYGALCKSLVHESFQAPPAEAYQRKPPKTAGKDPPAVGTVPPNRDYGLGDYGKTTYTDDYVNKLSKHVCRVCGLPFGPDHHPH